MNRRRNHTDNLRGSWKIRAVIKDLREVGKYVAQGQFTNDIITVTPEKWFERNIRIHYCVIAAHKHSLPCEVEEGFESLFVFVELYQFVKKN